MQVAQLVVDVTDQNVDGVMLSPVTSLLPDLDVFASTASGHGVQLVTVPKDLAQAHDRWGSDRADTIVNNHRARVIGGGIADERTLDYVARLLGDTEVQQQSSASAEHGRHSTTV